MVTVILQLFPCPYNSFMLFLFCFDIVVHIVVIMFMVGPTVGMLKAGPAVGVGWGLRLGIEECNIMQLNFLTYCWLLN